VEKTLEAFLSRQQGVLDDISVDLAHVVDSLTALLSDGKRLRPAFCYWGWRGAGGAANEGIITVGASLELLHACALLHDDVMDDSDTRRGMPAAHRQFAGLHRTRQWFGSPDSFGIGAAILLGDLCLSWSDELYLSADLDAKSLMQSHGVFDVMRTEVMAGQYLDLVEQVKGDATVDSTRTVMRFKSAKYTVERPLHLGAALAGGPPELTALYSAYGLPLGEAFQLRDDVLGVFGDPEQTGKPAGDDIREGKRTMLMALTIEGASPAQAAAVRRHLGDPHIDSEGIAQVREVIVDSGALTAIEARIESLTAEAISSLKVSLLDPEVADVLRDLAVAATTRAV
jgi:geranylgeranyl diphosphate synthase, type I